MIRLVVTGGGTGGHVYPALELARHAAEEGALLHYMGSLKGQEGPACERKGIQFSGFPSEALCSFKSFRGWRSLAKLLRSRQMAKKALADWKPDVVFSTGGFSAGPVVSAARALGIPYNIHSADSVPARSSSIYAREAFAFTSTFRCTARYAPNLDVIRTGHLLRKELRDASFPSPPTPSPVTNHTGEGALILVLGGSQGSEFLNETVPKAARLLPGVKFLHAVGPKNMDAMALRVEGLEDRYRAVPFLELEALVDAYRSATVVVGRSGGSMAEYALFRLPSVLVPLPSSALDHQLHNAEEFEEMGAATLVEQKDASPERLEQSIRHWLESAPARERAAKILGEWDVPDATSRVYELLLKAVAEG